jgi:transketolase
MSQEEFTKETTFVNTSKPNPDNPKQFKRWHELQLRKECHEGYEEIEAKEEEVREIFEETLKAIEENRF